MEHPVVYMQVNGVKAKTLAMNLRKHSRPGAIKTGHIEKKEICTWDLPGIRLGFAWDVTGMTG